MMKTQVSRLLSVIAGNIVLPGCLRGWPVGVQFFLWLICMISRDTFRQHVKTSLCIVQDVRVCI